MFHCGLDNGRGCGLDPVNWGHFRSKNGRAAGHEASPHPSGRKLGRRHVSDRRADAPPVVVDKRARDDLPGPLERLRAGGPHMPEPGLSMKRSEASVLPRRLVPYVPMPGPRGTDGRVELPAGVPASMAAAYGLPGRIRARVPVRRIGRRLDGRGCSRSRAGRVSPPFARKGIGRRMAVGPRFPCRDVRNARLPGPVGPRCLRPAGSAPCGPFFGRNWCNRARFSACPPHLPAAGRRLGLSWCGSGRPARPVCRPLRADLFCRARGTAVRRRPLLFGHVPTVRRALGRAAAAAAAAAADPVMAAGARRAPGGLGNRLPPWGIPRSRDVAARGSRLQAGPRKGGRLGRGAACREAPGRRKDRRARPRHGHPDKLRPRARDRGGQRHGHPVRRKTAQAQTCAPRAQMPRRDVARRLARHETPPVPRAEPNCVYPDDASGCAVAAPLSKEAASENAVGTPRGGGRKAVRSARDHTVGQRGVPRRRGDRGREEGGGEGKAPGSSWTPAASEADPPDRGMDLTNARPYRPQAGGKPGGLRRGPEEGTGQYGSLSAHIGHRNEDGPHRSLGMDNWQTPLGALSDRGAAGAIREGNPNRMEGEPYGDAA